jgi:molybdopterin molybdotransferase
MISVEEALKKILGEVSELDKEKKGILDCLGQVIARDIVSPFDIPLNNNSAMDGFAVNSKDISGVSGIDTVSLKIVGEVPAGTWPGVAVGNGECVRIMTGGIIPQGADTVVPVELTDAYGRDTSGIGQVKILNKLEAGANVRKPGEDVSKGEKVIPYGKIIRPAEVGVLASLGIRQIEVIRRPKVAILATGNEILDIKEKLTPGKLYNSNSYGLASQVIKYGGLPTILGIAKDNLSKLIKYIKMAVRYDLLVTSGGVSVGEYDLVKQVLSEMGTMSFWQVRMKPGKPLAFGLLNGENGKKVPHLGMPGNPVSCMLGFEIFGRPVIRKMLGAKETARKTVKASIQDKVINLDGRRIFTRVLVEENAGVFSARLTGSQSSGVLTSMIKANGLAIIPEDRPGVEPGDIVDVMLIDEE